MSGFRHESNTNSMACNSLNIKATRTKLGSVMHDTSTFNPLDSILFEILVHFMTCIISWVCSAPAIVLICSCSLTWADYVLLKLMLCSLFLWDFNLKNCSEPNTK